MFTALKNKITALKNKKKLYLLVYKLFLRIDVVVLQKVKDQETYFVLSCFWFPSILFA